jgi:hypothetical protein
VSEVAEARERMHHPGASPWWVRVAEVGEWRALWCESPPGSGAVISIQRFDGERWRYYGIPDPLADAETRWAECVARISELADVR